MRVAGIAVVALVLVFVATSASPASPTESGRPVDYMLLLKSRRFLPVAGVSEQLTAAQDTRAPRHLIVQFRRLPGKAEIRALKSLGIMVLDYLPNMAFYASVPAGGLQHLGRLDNVRAVLPIEKGDKIAPGLRRGHVSEHARREGGTAEITVIFFRDVAIEHAIEVAGMYGEVLSAIEDEKTVSLNIPEHLIDQLASHDWVQWVEEAAPPRVHLLDRVRATVGADIVQAPPYNLDGSGAALGMWESNGPAETHVDFTGRLYLPDGATAGSHATRVGGIMAGDGLGSEAWGGTPYQWRGIATAADIVSYTWATRLDELRAETAEAIRDYGIVSSNNSWGYFVCGYLCSAFGMYDSWSKQYDKMVRGKQGAPINVVFGAGNERECYECEDSLAHFPYGTISAPGATAKNTIAVGAVNAISKTMTTFSGWGPTLDGRVKPDLVAPGCNDSTGVMGPAPPNDYADSLCGTSWSTPVVSGSIGILRQQFDLLGYGYVMPHTYKAVLIQTAEDLGNAGPDYAYGHGLIDLKKAVDLIIADYPANELVRPDSVADSLMNTYYMDVEPGVADLRATLVWDDFQAASAAAKTLVNDLDLVVKSPVGTPYYAYKLDPDNPSAPAVTGYNDLDNVEVVEVTAPEAGRWTVEVRGTLVPEGPQHYTLVLPYGYPTGGVVAPEVEGLRFRLHSADPNPFRAATLITFEMAEPAPVKLSVYDVSGRLVRRLIDGAVRSAGRHVLSWDATDGEGKPVSPGVFFLRMEAGDYSGTGRVVFIR